MPIQETVSFFLGIHDDGQIEVRRTRRFVDDSVTPPELVGERHHRQVLEPGQDVSTFPKRLRDIAAVVWTPQVVADFRARAAAARLVSEG